MWLEEEINDNHPLAKKIEFMTLQSCERSEIAIHYKHINRKFIAFDLRDRTLMKLVGKTLKPFGFWQHLHDFFVDSKFRMLRIWSDIALAKRGEDHLRSLYLKHPEKFFNIEFADAHSLKMSLTKGSFVISEMRSEKKVSLHENQNSFATDMEEYRKRIRHEEERMEQEENLVNEFSPEREKRQGPLLGMDGKAKSE